MLSLAMVCAFLAVVLLIFGIFPTARSERRPTLNLQDIGSGTQTLTGKTKKKQSPLFFVRLLSTIIKPLIVPEMRRRLVRDLGISRSDMSPEDFMFFKIVTVVAFLILLPRLFPALR